MYRAANDSPHRKSKRGREGLAKPSDPGEHVHYEAKKSVGIGCITSRRSGGVTFWEQLAFELGCNVETARALWEKGLIK
jgi:hypothetical protein